MYLLICLFNLWSSINIDKILWFLILKELGFCDFLCLLFTSG